MNQVHPSGMYFIAGFVDTAISHVKKYGNEVVIQAEKMKAHELFGLTIQVPPHTPRTLPQVHSERSLWYSSKKIENWESYIQKFNQMNHFMKLKMSEKFKFFRRNYQTDEMAWAGFYPIRSIQLILDTKTKNLHAFGILGAVDADLDLMNHVAECYSRQLEFLEFTKNIPTCPEIKSVSLDIIVSKATAREPDPVKPQIQIQTNPIHVPVDIVPSFELGVDSIE